MKSIFSRVAIVAITVWLGLAASTANAVPVISGFDGSPTAGFNAVFGNTGVAATFNDSFLFTMPVGSSGSGAANLIELAVTGNNIILSAFNLFSTVGGVESIFATGTFSGIFASLSFANGPVPGNYRLNVQGSETNPLLSASYAGNIAISPVPEPETYAMLLAGLGLIGYSARRRKLNS